MSTKAQQIALDNALVAPEKQLLFGRCNMRINPNMKPKEPTYQFWATVNKHNASYQFKIDNKRELGHSGEIKFITDVSVDHLHQSWRAFAIIINKYLSGKDLAYQIDNKDSKKYDKMYYPRFTKAIMHHFLTKDKSISMRNRTSMHTAQDDSLLGTMRFVSRHEDTQVYGALLPKAMTNQAMLDSDSYKTYYAIATGAESPKPKKSNSTISSKKDVPSTKKLATKLTKKKAPVKADRGVPDEQQRKISGIDEGTGTKPGVLDVPKYDFESEKEYCGDSREEDDDDEDNSKDESDDDNGNDNDGDNDDNNDDSNDERTESDRDENPNLNQSNEEREEEEKYVDERVHTPTNYELTDEEDNANNAK
ncbi:hypothetical protein Tco_0799765 [Tanacetum coccineum]|uniref:Uncharacterized protein n=1 Tax=Tanacetum coccineum TaxID=301880 RepID=A0ABQ4ZUI4_9ASTR